MCVRACKRSSNVKYLVGSGRAAGCRPVLNWVSAIHYSGQGEGDCHCRCRCFCMTALLIYFICLSIRLCKHLLLYAPCAFISYSILLMCTWFYTSIIGNANNTRHSGIVLVILIVEQKRSCVIININANMRQAVLHVYTLTWVCPIEFREH